MNPQLKNIDLKQVLVLDIETASRYKYVLEEDPDMFKLFKYKRRDRETMELLPDEEALIKFNKEAALSAIFGQIVCITVCSWVDDKRTVHTFKGSEKNIIKQFVKLVKSRRFILVGHNLKFDLPFIRKRALHHNITPYLDYTQGLDVGVKPWDFNEVVIDTMELMKGVGWANESLEEACFLLGIPSSKDGEISGSEVSEAFHNGNIDSIVEYCEKDVIATSELFLKLKNF